MLAASYDFRCGLTPYVHLGYEMHWIFGRAPRDTAGVDYVERKGCGDHLLTVRAGLQYRFNRYVSLLAEYGYWRPVVDDPGDGFSYLQNHIVLVGVAFRVGLWGGSHRAMFGPVVRPSSRLVQPPPPPASGAGASQAPSSVPPPPLPALGAGTPQTPSSVPPSPLPASGAGAPQAPSSVQPPPPPATGAGVPQTPPSALPPPPADQGGSSE